MKDNPLQRIRSFGQSIWLDFISRSILSSGELEKLINEDGVTGVTTNPAIFDKAISDSRDYDDSIETLAGQGKSPREIFEEIAVEDVQRAGDLLYPVYRETQGNDGYVSIEVSPHLAHDTDRTIAEAMRLWDAVDCPNVLIKVPGTLAGLSAIRQLIGEGISVNVTLLFGLPRYRDVAMAYLAGMEERVTRGKPLERMTSVASFFLSRIDTLVDAMLSDKAKAQDTRGRLAQSLIGSIAVASAKTAYQIYGEIFGGSGFRKLAERGARPQRLLWASTGTKNAAYSDVKYVEPLIGPETVNTMTLETISAYRDHGAPASRLGSEGVAESRRVLDQLADVGISLEAATRQLEDEGIRKFIEAYDHLLETIEQKSSRLVGTVT